MPPKPTPDPTPTPGQVTEPPSGADCPSPATGAPHAGRNRKGVIRGKREQISHTLPPELLQRLDAEAQRKGLTRAGLINLALSEYLNK